MFVIAFLHFFVKLREQFS